MAFCTSASLACEFACLAPLGYHDCATKCFIHGAHAYSSRRIKPRTTRRSRDNRGAAEAILAVTFTNKAAEEMRNRVSALLLRAGVPPAQPWLSTFHSLCARLLRREAVNAGLPRDFAIYDDDDQLAAVKLALGNLEIDDEALTPRNVLSRISYAKNHGQSAEKMRSEAIDKDGRRVADIFAAYERLLHQSNALDFDDLLLRTVKLLRESSPVREKWQAGFDSMRVD